MLGNKWEEFDDLPHKEAKRRFSIIFDKIDRNHDKLVTREELRNWIKHVNNRVMSTEIDERFSAMDTNESNSVSWEEYKKSMYDMMDEEHLDHDENMSITDERISFREQMMRDERRFKFADMNNDEELTHEEFMAFDNPERFDHMIPAVVADTFDDLDRNKDGKISESEYLEDIRRYSDGLDEDAEDLTKTSDYLQEEAQEFRTKLDTDSNGYLNEDEVQHWIFPDNYDHVNAEVEHLFSSADSDTDGFLSKHEMIEQNMDVFVGSEALDFGDVLIRHHEF